MNKLHRYKINNGG